MTRLRIATVILTFLVGGAGASPPPQPDGTRESIRMILRAHEFIPLTATEWKQLGSEVTKHMIVDSLRVFLALLVQVVSLVGVWFAVVLLVPALRPTRETLNPLDLAAREAAAWDIYPAILTVAGVGFALLASPLYAWWLRRQESGRPRPIRAAFVVTLSVWVLMAAVVFAIADLKEMRALMLIMGVLLWVFLSVAGVLMRNERTTTGTLAVILTVVVGLWAGASAAADRWGSAQLDARSEVGRSEMAAERARLTALRMPVVSGEPVEENAAARYRKLFDAIKTNASREPDSVSALTTAASAAPLAAIDPKVMAVARERQPEIQALREAVRCSRVNWEFEYEKGSQAPIPDLLSARILANLLVIEGHQRAQAGDPQGAAERYLEVVRFGSDFGSGGTTMQDRFGLALVRAGAAALAGLLTADVRGVPHDFIAEAAARLGPVLPATLTGLRGERLSLSAQEADMNRPIPRWIRLFAPSRFLIAEALGAIDPVLRRAESLATEPGSIGYEAALDLSNELSRPRSPIIAEGFLQGAWSLRELFRDRADAQAWFRLAMAAVRIEKARFAARGEIPVDAGALDLPVDPHNHPSRLRFEPTDSGYRVWSVGRNGKDETGRSDSRSDDIRVERTKSALPPTAASPR